MQDEIPTALRQLWALAGSDPLDAKNDWNEAFEPVGLILFAPPRNAGYWCTPVNSLSFATTGGDGVHYSLLATEGGFTDLSPVVMTVPMCDTPNVIVGGNLKEFLALGCRFGYFSLEQLIYHPERTLAELEAQHFDPELRPVERALLQRISAHFSVAPWSHPQHRLEELRSQHSGSIVLPPQGEHAA
ncbi:MAG TPA: hypothetical protein VFO36_01665 [Nitrospiraceae bacterium]|nr:hypothetical protein [Nitrospiraceae bacterium]